MRGKIKTNDVDGLKLVNDTLGHDTGDSLLVAAAQEDVNLAREKYNLGAATILEVLDAEVSLKQAQTNQVQALFDYNLAISRLEKAMGRE